MIKSLKWNALFSISLLKYMLETLKRTISWNGSFEHPKQFIKQKHQNYISTILHLRIFAHRGGGGGGSLAAYVGGK